MYLQNIDKIAINQNNYNKENPLPGAEKTTINSIFKTKNNNASKTSELASGQDIKNLNGKSGELMDLIKLTKPSAKIAKKLENSAVPGMSDFSNTIKDEINDIGEMIHAALNKAGGKDNSTMSKAQIKSLIDEIDSEITKIKNKIKSLNSRANSMNQFDTAMNKFIANGGDPNKINMNKIKETFIKEGENNSNINENAADTANTDDKTTANGSLGEVIDKLSEYIVSDGKENKDSTEIKEYINDNVDSNNDNNKTNDTPIFSANSMFLKRNKQKL